MASCVINSKCPHCWNQMPELPYDHTDGVISRHPDAKKKINNLAGEKRLFISGGYAKAAGRSSGKQYLLRVAGTSPPHAFQRRKVNGHLPSGPDPAQSLRYGEHDDPTSTDPGWTADGLLQVESWSTDPAHYAPAQALLTEDSSLDRSTGRRAGSAQRSAFPPDCL